MLDTDRVRQAFPHLARHVYLNTAAAGLSWVGQGEAAAEFYEVGKSKGMGGASDWAAKVVAAKSELSELTGVPAPSIDFVGSTTEGLNLVALSLPLRQGDKVVFAEDEFPSVIQSFLTWRNKGVELVPIPVPNEAQRTEALCAAVKSGVRVLAVSHVHWRSGTLVNLEQLSARCRKYNCRLIVDGVQAVGATKVEAGLADAYCASVFKWLLSGFGLGFVTLSEQLAGELQPLLLGYSNEPPSRSIRYGHINYPGVYALQASLAFMRSLGWDNIHSEVARLAGRTLQSLRDRGFDVLTPDVSHAGIVSIQHPAASTLVRLLAQQAIFVEDRGPFLRISPHFYNTFEDVDRFVEALARAA